MRIRGVHRFCILVACLLVTAACSGSTTAEDSGGFSIEAALADLPLSTTGEQGFDVAIADLVGAADQGGIQRPPTGSTDRDELIDFIGGITGFRPDGEGSKVFVSLPQLLTGAGAMTDAESFVAEFGFSPGDVTRVAAVMAGSSQFLVFDGVQTRADLPEVAPGVGTIGEGEDLSAALEARTLNRPLGRPHRVAERDGRVGISLQTSPLVEWLEESAEATLADDEVMVSLARRLDDNKVVSAMLFGGRDDDGFRPTAVGWAVDGQGPLGVITIHFGTDAAAEDNTEALRASIETGQSMEGDPVAESITLESLEREGAQLVTRVRFPADSGPGAIFDLLIRREGPFACCDS